MRCIHAWRTLAGVACAALCSTVLQAQPRWIPLPDVSAGVELTVAYAHNPRLAEFGAEQQLAVLHHATAVVRAHFGLEVRFAPVQAVPLADLFARIPAAQRAHAERERLDPSSDPMRQGPMARSLLREMAAIGNLTAQRQFALPHLLSAPGGSSDLALAQAVVATQHRLLLGWAAMRGTDGQPLLGADRFHEYTYWSALGASGMPFDIVLTNQLVASAEKSENSVHSALRGGVSNGITTQSLGGRLGLYAVVSAFPFHDNAPQTLALRGGALAQDGEAARQMGALLAHEIGHLLLHLGHPFGNPACLMTPPQRLEFAAWLRQLDPGRCRLADSAANTPGAIRFTAPTQMFRRRGAAAEGPATGWADLERRDLDRP